MSVDTNDGVIILNYPIPVIVKGEDGKEETVETTKLKLKRIKAGVLRQLPDDFMDRDGALRPSEVLTLLGALTNLPQSSIDEIDLDDIPMLADELNRYMSKKKSPQTGEQSSEV